MSRYGLRVGPAYPWPKYRGDVIHLGDSTREQVEEIREQMATGEFHEVVELDAAGQVVEPTMRRHTCSCTSGDECPHDCPCDGSAA